MAAAGEQLRVPGRWLSFATGLSVGLATGLLGVGLAVAWERARRAQRQGAALAEPLAHDLPGSHAPIVHPPARTAATLEQRELDEELAQSFPASDPLPHSHQVD